MVEVMKTGLLLIDLQNDYFKGGKNELVQPEKAAEQAKRILEVFRKNDWPIFHVQHISTRSDAGFFAPDTIGVNFYKDVCPRGQEVVIVKHTPDSFHQTMLRDSLESQKVSHLVVCGMMTHMCIDTTVRSAKNWGYNVTLIEDACATMNLVWKEEVIPATVVQNVFCASLSGSFATIKIADNWIKEEN